MYLIIKILCVATNMLEVIRGEFTPDEKNDQSSKLKIFEATKPIAMQLGRIIDGKSEAERDVLKIYITLSGKRSYDEDKPDVQTMTEFTYGYEVDSMDGVSGERLKSPALMNFDPATHYGFKITIETKPSATDKVRPTLLYQADFT